MKKPVLEMLWSLTRSMVDPSCLDSCYDSLLRRVVRKDGDTWGDRIYTRGLKIRGYPKRGGTCFSLCRLSTLPRSGVRYHPFTLHRMKISQSFQVSLRILTQYHRTHSCRKCGQTASSSHLMYRHHSRCQIRPHGAPEHGTTLRYAHYRPSAIYLSSCGSSLMMDNLCKLFFRLDVPLRTAS